jgi:fumarate hydratase subunit beta
VSASGAAGVPESIRIALPWSEQDLRRVRSGDRVLLTGVMYGARDAAHKRMVEALDRGEKLPIDVRGQTIYFVGPTPPKPGEIIGSAGPTTASRMDRYTPRLLELGLKAMVGKGYRTQPVIDAMAKHGAIYMAAIGGLGAKISKTIRKSEAIAYQDLGTEAIWRFEVEDFPAVVIYDLHGGDLYKQAQAPYATLQP